jgi:MFS family permease
MLTGIASACFAAMQGTLVYLAAPPEFRSRVLGVLTLCIGTGPIGFFNVGWMAEQFGVPAALAIISAEGLFALLVLWIWGESQDQVNTPRPSEMK